MALTRKHVVVAGLVQGVGYRWFAMEAARSCRVTGWVRNNPDGTVEAEAQGTPAAIAGFVSALRRGPRSSRIESVQESDVGVKSGETDFDVH
ncbi:MAG: acylphosphatase [Elusimicrobia bacterium]|nr:acylphosphatase [Elusimicrobiota bacterium]